MERQNVILILCDQLRFDALGVETPNLDWLAGRGTRFLHAYSAVPSCIPARAILWTGQTQWHAGILGMGAGQGPIPADYPHTLAGELSRAGYEARLVGKGHFQPQRASMGFERTEIDESGRTLPHGFLDDYRSWFARNAPFGVTPDDHGVNWNSWHSRPWHTAEHLHPSAWTMSRALAFLGSRDRRRPFFLNLSFARPHSPYVPPASYLGLIADTGVQAPARGLWSEEHAARGEPADPNAWRGRMSDRTIRRARVGYHGEVAFIDTQIGRLLNWLERFAREEMDRTWFLFTSDHGDMLGDHDLWRKTYALEGSAHVPFLVVPPLGGPRPARPIAGEVVELRDVMPTILEIAGVPIPACVDGASVLPLLDEPADRWRTHVHGEHCTCYGPEHEMQYVTDGLRKLIWHPRTGAEHFFDLEADPGEGEDLIREPDRADEIALWRARLTTELQARDCGWVAGGRPHCPDEGPLVSPYGDVRWDP